MKQACKTLTSLLLGAFMFLGTGIQMSFAVDGDITFTKLPAGSGGIPQAFFPHWVHRIRYRCSACHNELFIMKKGANEISMSNIQKGQYCGACHNGKAAFNVELQTCARCHPTQTKVNP